MLVGGWPPRRHYTTPHTAAVPRAAAETSYGETRHTRPRHLATYEPASDAWCEPVPQTLGSLSLLLVSPPSTPVSRAAVGFLRLRPAPPPLRPAPPPRQRRRRPVVLLSPASTSEGRAPR